jgi:hypothetical protein
VYWFVVVIYVFSETRVNEIFIRNKHSRYLNAVYFKKISDMVRTTTLVGRWKTNNINISDDGRIRKFNPAKPAITTSVYILIKS